MFLRPQGLLPSCEQLPGLRAVGVGALDPVWPVCTRTSTGGRAARLPLLPRWPLPVARSVADADCRGERVSTGGELSSLRGCSTASATPPECRFRGLSSISSGHKVPSVLSVSNISSVEPGQRCLDPPPTASRPGRLLERLGECSSIQHERVHRSGDLVLGPATHLFPSFVHRPVDPAVHVRDRSLRGWEHDTQGLGELIVVLDHVPVAGKARVDCHSHQRSSRTMDATCDILPETQSPHPIVHLS